MKYLFRSMQNQILILTCLLSGVQQQNYHDHNSNSSSNKKLQICKILSIQSNFSYTSYKPC